MKAKTETKAVWQLKAGDKVVLDGKTITVHKVEAGETRLGHPMIRVYEDAEVLHTLRADRELHLA